MFKRILLAFLIIFLVFVILTLHFIDKVYFLCPIEYEKGIIIRRDSFGQGDYNAPRAGGRKHEGIDLYASIGAAVRAPCFARVIEVGFHERLGNYVELSHKNNLISIYGHLNRILVRPGHWVAQGRVIGRAGKSGNANHPSILPHLHFEIRQAGIPLDPSAFLSIKESSLE